MSLKPGGLNWAIQTCRSYLEREEEGIAVSIVRHDEQSASLHSAAACVLHELLEELTAEQDGG